VPHCSGCREGSELAQLGGVTYRRTNACPEIAAIHGPSPSELRIAGYQCGPVLHRCPVPPVNLSGSEPWMFPFDIPRGFWYSKWSIFVAALALVGQGLR
jgi:hypothetical protein